MRKFLSFILSLAIITSTFPMNALVASADQASLDTVAEVSDNSEDVSENDTVEPDKKDEDDVNTKDDNDTDKKGDANVGGSTDDTQDNIDNEVEDIVDNDNDEVDNSDNDTSDDKIISDKDDEDDDNNDDNVANDDTNNVEEKNDNDNNKVDNKDKETSGDKSQDEDIKEGDSENEPVINGDEFEVSKKLEEAKIDLKFAFKEKEHNVKLGNPVGAEKDDIVSKVSLNSSLKLFPGEIVLDYLPTFEEITEYEFLGWYIGTGNNDKNGEKMPDDYEMPNNKIWLIPHFKPIEDNEIKFDKEITVKVGEKKVINPRFADLDKLDNSAPDIISVKKAKWANFSVKGIKVGTAYVTAVNNRNILSDQKIVYKVNVVPEEPVTIDAKYFVLLPDQTIDDLGKEQSWQYAPNDNIKIGTWDTDTGIPGKLYSLDGVEEAGYDGLRDYDGFGSEYVNNPDEMGGFDYNGINYDLEDYDIVWYKIKYHKSEKAYHVDGYIKGEPVEVAYQWDGKTIKHQGDNGKIYSGDIITLVDNTYTNFEKTDHIFKGWKVNIEGEEKLLQPGEELRVLNSMIIEPDWEKVNFPLFNAEVFVDETKTVTPSVEFDSVEIEDNAQGETLITVSNVKENESFDITGVVEGSARLVLKSNGDTVAIYDVTVNPKQVPVDIEVWYWVDYLDGTNAISRNNNDLTPPTTSLEGKQLAYKYNDVQLTKDNISQLANDYINELAKTHNVAGVKYSYFEIYQYPSDYKIYDEPHQGGGTIFRSNEAPINDIQDIYDVVLKGKTQIRLIFEGEAKNYTITYKNNLSNVDIQNMPTEVEKVKGGASIVLPTTNPSAVGYNFLGWFDEQGNQVTNQSTMPTKDIVLTAKFEKASYKVSYKAIDINNPEATLDGVEKMPTIDSVEFGSSINNIVDGVEPVKHGYQFLYWRYNGGDVINQTAPGSDFELVACFERNLFDVNYVVEGIDEQHLSALENLPKDQKDVLKGTDIIPPNPTVEGYKFLGWFNEGEKVDSITADKDYTLIAKFEKLSYKLSFKAIDIDSQTELTGIADFPTEKTVLFDTSINDLVKDLELTKEGYNFLGWFDEQGNEVSSESQMPSKDITLTAKFETISYKLTFKTIDIYNTQSDLTEVTNMPTINSVKFGSSIKKIVDGVEPTKHGYQFLYWRYNGAEIITQTTVPSSDIELVACFERNLFDVNYAVDGIDQQDLSKLENFPQDQKDVLKGTEITLNDPTAQGYVFLGWFNGDKKVNKIEVNSDYNLTAKFAKEATVEFWFYAYEDGSCKPYKVVGEFYEGANFPLTENNIKFAANEHLTKNAISNFRYSGDFQVILGNDDEPVYYSNDKENSQFESLDEIKLSPGRNSIYVGYEKAHNINVNYYRVDGENQQQLGSYQISKIFEGDEAVISDEFDMEKGFNIVNNYLKPNGYKLTMITTGDYKTGESIPNPFVMLDKDVEVNVFYSKDNEQWKDFKVDHIYNGNKEIENKVVSTFESKVINENFESTPVLKNKDVDYVLSSVTVNGITTKLVNGKVSGIIEDNTNIVFTYDVDENFDGIADKYQATFTFKSFDEKMGKVIGEVTQIVSIEEGKAFKVTANVTPVVESGYKFVNWTASINGATVTFENLDAIKASEFSGDVVFMANWEAVLGGNTGGGSHRPHRPSRPSDNTDPSDGGTPVEVIEIPDIPTPLTDTPIVSVQQPYISSQDTNVALVTNDEVAATEEDNDFEVIEIEDESVPLASTPVSGWSLVNLILTVFTVLSSFILLMKNKSIFKTLSIFPAIGSVIAFILTENMSNPMIMSDKWTFMMCIIAVIQAVVVGLSIKGKKDEDTQEN